MQRRKHDGDCVVRTGINIFPADRPAEGIRHAHRFRMQQRRGGRLSKVRQNNGRSSGALRCGVRHSRLRQRHRYLDSREQVSCCKSSPGQRSLGGRGCRANTTTQMSSASGARFSENGRLWSACVRSSRPPMSENGISIGSKCLPRSATRVANAPCYRASALTPGIHASKNWFPT